ncbi:hypothetical protein INS49_003358 [Diaporthe citri]|uniref:uncharacterized protein n=1 Tax=Diaporthe citri TaxID=83186 RepID=UPI001C7FC922|nr:uncharacterized protein INS49_003358 [Diaporthe citri]KAG6355396.1 hypothetical protein INS49_003358 [Diaporthe citri]
MSSSPLFTSPNTPATSAVEVDNDPFNLERFIKAQDQGNAFENVLAAFRGGHQKPKPATWMWFVFPQMDHCQTQSLRVKLSDEDNHLSYEGVDEQTWLKKDVWPRGQVLTSLDEARAYLNHPILGNRARVAATVVLHSPFADKFSLMDNASMDVACLHSSMTIFRQAGRFPKCIHSKMKRQPGENRVFAQVINRFFVEFVHSDEENDWLDYDDRQLMAYKRGSRHKATLECLDRREQVEIERRLKQGLGCVCGLALEKVKEMDRGSKRKMTNAQAVAEAEKKRRKRKMEQERKKREEKGMLYDGGGPSSR